MKVIAKKILAYGKGDLLTRHFPPESPLGPNHPKAGIPFDIDPEDFNPKIMAECHPDGSPKNPEELKMAARHYEPKVRQRETRRRDMGGPEKAPIVEPQKDSTTTELPIPTPKTEGQAAAIPPGPTDNMGPVPTVQAQKRRSPGRKTKKSNRKAFKE